MVTHDPDQLVSALWDRPAAERPDWLAAHTDQLSLAVVAALKRRSDACLLSEPLTAEGLTACALAVAQRCPHEPLAYPLAAWARGNWANYHDPAQAVQCYQTALAGYRSHGTPLEQARLLSNLVAALTECGRFEEARAAYWEANALLEAQHDQTSFFRLALDKNYGWLLDNMGDYHAALLVHERVGALAAALELPQHVMEAQVNRTLALGMLGHLAESEQTLLACRAVASTEQQEVTVARIDMNLGALYAAQGRVAEALRALGLARQEFASQENLMEVGSVLLREAALFEQIGALHEAQRCYDEARHAFEHFAMRPQIGIALVRGAALHRRTGAYRQASQLLDAADELWRALEQPHWSLLVRYERAELALAQRDPAGALALLELPLPAPPNPASVAQHDLLLAEAQRLQWAASGLDALRASAQQHYSQVQQYAQAQAVRWMERRALAGLGQLARTDDPTTAQQLWEQAAALDDQIRQALSIEELKASFHAQANDLLPLLARLAVEQDQPLQALRYGWRAKGSALLELLCATAPRQDAGEPAAIEALRQQLATHRWRQALHARADGPAGLIEQQDPTIADLERQLVTLRRARNQQGDTEAATLVADAAGLLARMDADLLIEYLRCGEDLLALCGDRQGHCRAIWLAGAAELADLAAQLQLRFQKVVLHGGAPTIRQQQHARWMAQSLPLLRRCYDLLIAPLGPLPSGGRLIIAPCAPLSFLPFAALWDGQHFLTERYELELMPSGALLAAPPAPPAATAAPVLVATSADGQIADADGQIAAIRALFPASRCLIDLPQTYQALKQMADAPQFLHLATHSVIRPGDAAIFSALQLTGELLSVESCYELPLAGTTLVTLSGCTTATGLDSGGALLAFQSALFLAGAQRVVSSLWPIHADDAARCMALFYQALAAGLAPAAALRQMQQGLRGDDATAHPAVWAAFTCSCR